MSKYAKTFLGFCRKQLTSGDEIEKRLITEETLPQYAKTQE